MRCEEDKLVSSPGKSTLSQQYAVSGSLLGWEVLWSVETDKVVNEDHLIDAKSVPPTPSLWMVVS